MKVLFLYDDEWHSYDVIDRGLKSFTANYSAYSFDFVRSAKDILTKEMIAGYPVIVNAKCNQINGANKNAWFEEGVTEVMPADFVSYVRDGGGFLSLHSGNAFWVDGERRKSPDSNSRANEDYIRFVGNSFIGHPPRCAVTVYPAGEHPITRGVSAFTERDEHYQLGDLAPDIHVFLKSRSETGGERIAGYVREMGKGRLCALTPGHHVKVWENPEFQKLLAQAIDWCAGRS